MYHQKKGHVREQQKGDHLQARKRDLPRNPNFQHLDLGPLASRIVRKYISVYKPLSQWYFVMAAGADLGLIITLRETEAAPQLIAVALESWFVKRLFLRNGWPRASGCGPEPSPSNSHLWSPCGLENTFPVNLIRARCTAMCP